MGSSNKEMRDHFSWAIEAATVRRDHWKVRSEEDLGEEGQGFHSQRMAELNNDLYEESQHNAKGIAEGITKGIEYARTMVTETEALMAMMIMENAIEATEGKGKLRDGIVMDWLCAEEGAYEARDNALRIAPMVCEASDWAYKQGFDMSEDWEWLPRFLPYLVTQVEAPKDVNQAHCDEAARLALVDYNGEKS